MLVSTRKPDQHSLKVIQLLRGNRGCSIAKEVKTNMKEMKGGVASHVGSVVVYSLPTSYVIS